MSARPGQARAAPAAQDPLPARFLRPRHWGAWTSVGFLWLLGHLPDALARRAGYLLGWLMFKTMARRRHIARTNLGLCFPELSEAGREALLRRHFRSLGMGFVETGIAWWGTDERLRSKAEVRGLEHLHEALGRGRGVLLLSAHFTNLELGLKFLLLHHSCDATYRPHNDPVFERMQIRRRGGALGKLIARDDVRTLFVRLKQNRAVWYAPDQNYNPRYSVFVPFMGVPAATITATARIARATGAAIVPFFQHRLPGDARYELVLLPALTDFPSGDAHADAARVNAVIEEQVRRSPEQYLWAHRRFKSRPPGEPPVY